MDTAKESFGFTAADLCIATYVASIIGDIPALQGWATHNLRDDQLPPTLQALRQDLRATAVATYARRIYRQNRPVDKQSGCVAVRPARRNATPWRTMFVVAAAATTMAVVAWRRRQ